MQGNYRVCGLVMWCWAYAQQAQCVIVVVSSSEQGYLSSLGMYVVKIMGLIAQAHMDAKGNMEGVLRNNLFSIFHISFPLSLSKKKSKKCLLYRAGGRRQSKTPKTIIILLFSPLSLSPSLTLVWPKLTQNCFKS